MNKSARPLRPEIANIISMIAEACLDDFERELASNNYAQAADPTGARKNPLPDSNQSREVTA